MRMPGFTATDVLPTGRPDSFVGWTLLGCWCHCGLICAKGSTDICWYGCECQCWYLGPVTSLPS